MDVFQFGSVPVTLVSPVPAEEAPAEPFNTTFDKILITRLRTDKPSSLIKLIII